MFNTHFKKLLNTFAVTVALLGMSSSAHALVATGSGVVIAPPASVVGGATEAPLITIFEESSQNFAGPLSVNVLTSAAGLGGSFTTAFQVPGALSINPWEQVKSYMVHFDTPGSSLLSLSSDFIFNHDVLAIIYGDTLLNASDFLGNPGTTYPTGSAGRGFEPVGAFSDQVSWVVSTPNRIAVQLNVSSGIDQIRIITRAPEPSTYLTMGVFLMAAAFAAQRKKKRVVA